MSFKKTVIFEKNAVPDQGAKDIDKCLDELRPSSFMLDKSAEACTDASAIQTGALDRYGELHIDTGNTFVNQWRTEYTSMAIPFVIPRCISGPDYPYAERWRRRDDENFTVPVCTAATFMRGFAQRIERQVVTD